VSENEKAAAPEPLEFTSDRGASRSVWAAAAILVALVAWMGSGLVLPSEDGAQAPDRPEPQPAAVMVRDSRAEPVTLTFGAEGQALPDRDTSLRAEASGNVVELLHDKADEVETGEVIARLSTTRAQVTAAEEALEDLQITAPFAGRIETLSLDEGEFVSAGEAVGRIVDNRPLTVAIQVPQQALGRIRDGQTATVRFITGEVREGVVSFVGTSAAAETRTFLAEIEVPNADRAIPAGISAEIEIPTGTAMAHFIEPSIVSLSAEGDLGVKTVEDGIVRFYPIEIVKAELDGVWAEGLPEEARIVTIGQGFVREGDAVRPRPEEEINGTPGTSEPGE